jgi:hypothetical protein
MVKKLVSRSEFARRAGVSAAAVTKACNSTLKAALDGKRIDAAHPSAIAYLENKAAVQTAPAPEKKTSPAKPHVRGHAAARETKKSDALEQVVQKPSAVVHETPGDIREFEDYTLLDLIERFGTDTAFLDWLKATKAIEDIHEKRLKNAEKAGELISRDIVADGLVSTIDGAFTRMLTDGAKTIAVRAHSLVTTGADVGDIEALVSKQLTTFIRPTKSKLKRVLNNA